MCQKQLDAKNRDFCEKYVQIKENKKQFLNFTFFQETAIQLKKIQGIKKYINDCS